MNGSGNIKLICLDTSLFIYFFESNPEFYLAAETYFHKLENGTAKAVTTILTLTELLSLRNPSVPEQQVIQSFFDTPNLAVVEINQTIAIEAARIRREYKFKLADSIQLATAKVSKAKSFITNDQKLKEFKEINIILLKAS